MAPGNGSLDAVRDRLRHMWSRDTAATSRYRDSPDDGYDGNERDGEAPVTPAVSYVSETELLVPAYMTPKPWTRKRSFFMCGAVWLAML